MLITMYQLFYFMTNNYFRLFKIETKRTNLECEHQNVSVSTHLSYLELSPDLDKSHYLVMSKFSVSSSFYLGCRRVDPVQHYGFFSAVFVFLHEICCNAGYLGSIPGLGRFPGGGGGNPLQYSFLENPHGQKILAGYSPWGCKESDTTEQLSTAHRT